MLDSISVGRLAGVAIRLSWSFFAVFLLVIWALVSSVFPDQNPGLSHTSYLVMGVAGGMLFFVSILLHELGHAVQARRDGMPIDGITLWIFGGIAAFRGDFPSPAAEFRVVAAGPLVSLTIGAVALAVTGVVSLPEEADGVLTWLGYTNLFLLAFNLLPAAPLDGGRLLRALLWRLRGDPSWATRVSTTAGQIVGGVIAAGGVMLTLATGAIGGLWLAVIGWFLATSASAEGRQQQALDTLAGVRVDDVMIRDPVTVDGDLTIGEFVDSVVGQRHFTTYPVVQAGRVSGLLPFRRLATVPRSSWDEVTLGERMVPLAEVPLVKPDDDLLSAARALGGGDLKRALVSDGQLIVGLLSITDIAAEIDRRSRRGR